MFITPIARFATRPGSGKLKDFDKSEIQDMTPDLIMGTLMRSGAHLLKSDMIYELVMNEMTGIIELREVGRSIIGKKWAHEYHTIPLYHGNKVWLSRDELERQEREEA